MSVTDDLDDGRRRWPIRHAGTTLGTLVAPAELAERGSLVPKVLDAAALAVEIARLRVGLRRQLDEVEASRARIVAAGDEERRRIERDLHDGAQQRLVSIGLALRHALGPGVDPEVNRTLDDAVAEITVAIDELRELARGLRPAHLDTGLGPALRNLAYRAPLPVDVVANGALSLDFGGDTDHPGSRALEGADKLRVSGVQRPQDDEACGDQLVCQPHQARTIVGADVVLMRPAHPSELIGADLPHEYHLVVGWAE